MMQRSNMMSDISPFEMTSMGIRACTAGWLSYLFGWIGGLVFLVLERRNRFVRFHAMQSLLFAVVVTIFEAVVRAFEGMFGWMGIGFMPFGFVPFIGFGIISGIVGIVILITWIKLMIRAAHGCYYKLPVIGDLAESYANQGGW